MRTTPNPGIPRRPTAAPVQKRPNEMDEVDDLRHTKRRSSHWEYRDGCDVLLWANTTRRPTEVSSPPHEAVLREAKHVLVARIFSGGGPKLPDGRMCWPESSPSALSKLMEKLWLDTANKLGLWIGVQEGCVARKPRNFEARKVSYTGYI
jgi:hypothetical protein